MLSNLSCLSALNERFGGDESDINKICVFKQNRLNFIFNYYLNHVLEIPAYLQLSHSEYMNIMMETKESIHCVSTTHKNGLSIVQLTNMLNELTKQLTRLTVTNEGSELYTIYGSVSICRNGDSDESSITLNITFIEHKPAYNVNYRVIDLRQKLNELRGRYPPPSIHQEHELEREQQKSNWISNGSSRIRKWFR